MADTDPKTIVGIDFGTSNTVAVLARGGRPAVPLLFDGSPILPSSVFAGDDRLLIGRDAERASMSDPARFEPNPKRCITDGVVLLGELEHPVIALIGSILRRVADEVQRIIGPEPYRAVLTYPAAWGGERLKILSTAARFAGMSDVAFTPEPVAAATHFSVHLGHTFPEGSHILVYDLGGGTFDVSVVRGSSAGIEVVATAGLPDIGGVDIDHAVITHLRDIYPDDGELWDKLATPVTPNDRRFSRSLRHDARGAKEILSRESSASIYIPILDKDAHLTRDELNVFSTVLLDRTIRLTESVIADANLDPSKLAGLFLVGGASRMPLVSTLLLRRIQVAPTVLEQPELVVASGAVDAPTIPAPELADPSILSRPLMPRRFEASEGAWSSAVPSSDLLIPDDQASTQESPPLNEESASTDDGADETASQEPEPPNDPQPDQEPDPPSEQAHTVAPPRYRGVAKVPTRINPPMIPMSAPTVMSPVHTDSHSLTKPPPPAPPTTLSATVKAPEEFPGRIAALAVRDVSQIAVAAAETVTIWDIAAGHDLAELEGMRHTPPVLAWSPGGGKLLAAADGSRVRIWTMFGDDDSRVSDNAPNPSRIVSCPSDVVLMSWGQHGLAIGNGEEIFVWNPTTGDIIRVWRFGAEGDKLRSLSWSRDGSRLAAGGVSGRVKVWRVDTDTPSLDVRAEVSARTLAWSADDNRLAAGDAAGNLYVWLVAVGAGRPIRNAHRAAVTSLAWAPDGERFVSGGIDGELGVWDAPKAQRIQRIRGLGASVTQVAWSHDGAHIIAAAGPRIMIWNAVTGVRLS